MSLRLPAVAAALSILMALSGAAVQAADGVANDLREIRIGMAVHDLPVVGYADLACATGPARRLPDWNAWADCPAGPAQTRAIRFGYDPAVDREGTKVAGHPVLLTLFVDDAGHVAGLIIATDPKSRFYMHKKAFLLGMQAKSRYGADGWSCSEQQPTGDEQPVGGVFINEQCSKSVNDRAVTIERRLYRHADQELKDFTDETLISIMAAKG